MTDNNNNNNDPITFLEWMDIERKLPEMAGTNPFNIIGVDGASKASLAMLLEDNNSLDPFTITQNDEGQLVLTWNLALPDEWKAAAISSAKHFLNTTVRNLFN
jgi:hypothetical protein